MTTTLILIVLAVAIGILLYRRNFSDAALFAEDKKEEQQYLGGL